MEKYSNWGVRFLALLVPLAITASVLLSGCGGGSNTSITTPTTNWKQVDATYVGRYTCRDCHANIDDQFANNPKGFTGDNLTHEEMATGTCARCHVTGFGEPGGGTVDPGGDSDPTRVPLSGLYGVTCESCHGPGSKHAAANSAEGRIANITRIPNHRTTCDNCHDGSTRFRLLDSPVAPVTEATLATQNPGLRGPHYAGAASMLRGLLGYNILTPMVSPHGTLQNACIDCHLQPKLNPATGKVDHGADQLEPTTDTTQAQCSACHGGLVRQELPLQAGIKEMLIQLGGEDPTNPGEPIHPGTGPTGGLLNDFAVAHGIDLTTNNTPDDPFVKAYKGARHSYQYVNNDGSLGVHNPGMTRKLLEDAINAMTPVPE